MPPLVQTQVLVLDPDPSIRVLLRAMLQRSGLHVTACGSGNDAAARCLHRSHYTLVILSSDMPRFDALLAEICRPPSAERPKLIIATTPEMTPPAVEADLFLIKPFQLAELDEAVAACCDVRDDDRPPRQAGRFA
jgi:DNA-binding response OmpR family regulator